MRYMIQEPKTEEGIRFVPMSDEVAECFRKVIAQRPAPENEPEVHRACAKPQIFPPAR